MNRNILSEETDFLLEVSLYVLFIKTNKYNYG